MMKEQVYLANSDMNMMLYEWWNKNSDHWVLMLATR